MSREDYVAALRAGNAADVGAVNPYAGRGMLADLWRAGYQEMLKRRIAESVARQSAGETETPRP